MEKAIQLISVLLPILIPNPFIRYGYTASEASSKLELHARIEGPGANTVVAVIEGVSFVEV